MDAIPATTADAFAQAASPQAIAEYKRKLQEYQEARAAFEAEAGAYWSSISEKRRGRNAKRRDQASRSRCDDYVVTQPPIYSRAGQAGRSIPAAAREEATVGAKSPIPVVADSLHGRREQYRFVPQRPQAKSNSSAPMRRPRRQRA